LYPALRGIEQPGADSLEQAGTDAGDQEEGFVRGKVAMVFSKRDDAPSQAGANTADAHEVYLVGSIEADGNGQMAQQSRIHAFDDEMGSTTGEAVPWQNLVVGDIPKAGRQCRSGLFWLPADHRSSGSFHLDGAPTCQNLWNRTLCREGEACGLDGG